MVRRTCLQILELAAGLVAGTAIVFVLVVWRLSQGPVSVAFLTPYAEEMLSAEGRGLKVEIADTILTWGGWSRGVDVRVIGVRLFGPGGTPIGRLPELAVGLSGAALAQGVLAPSSIDLFGPEITVRRTLEGGFEIGVTPVAGGDEQTAPDFLQRLLTRLGNAGDRSDPLDYIEIVNVIEADITLDDQVREKTWRAPAGYFSVRRVAGGLKAEASLSLQLGPGPRTDFDVSGTYAAARRQANVIVNFDDLAPAAVAELVPAGTYLETLDLPLSGTAAFDIGADGVFDTVALSLQGAAGAVHLPAPAQQTVALDGMVLRATYDARDRRLAVDELTLDVAEEARVRLPAPIDHAYDVRSVTARLTADLDTRRIEVDALDVVFGGGPQLTASAVIDGLGLDGSSVSVDLDATITDVAGDDVRDYWPASVGEDAYAWVTEHISGGEVPKATLRASLWSSGDGGFELVSMTGEMRAEGVRVDYLPPMPPAHDVSADMRFDSRQFEIWIDGGQAPGLSVRHGTVQLTQLDTDSEQASINLAIDGGVRAALELIDHEPLGFAGQKGIDPATAAGNAEITLKLALPLRNDLTVDKVRVDARALLENAKVGNVVFGHDLDAGELRLDVDNDKMNVRGRAEVAGLPMNLRWTDNFNDDAEFQARYEFATTFHKVSQLTDLGLDVSPLDDDMLSGSIATRVRFTQVDDATSRVEAEADLTQARIAIPKAEWSKAAGVPGEARFTMALSQDVITAIPRFELHAGDLIADGSVTYASDGSGLERVDFARLAFGRNDVSGALIARPEGAWEVGLQGKMLDLSPYWEDIKSPDPNERDPDSFAADLTVLAEVDKVYVDDTRSIDGFSITAARRADLWRNMTLTGRLEGTTPFQLRIAPTGPATRRLSLTTPDAGRTLAFFELYDSMRGGRLSITGEFDDAAIGHPLRGTVRVADYRVVNAPLMARVLSIMALTGVLDAMQGDGLAFDELDLPFTLTDGTLELADARAAGRSLGFTASGKVYTHAEVVDLQGTVVPAYAINSLLGRIPFLGELLTGPEEGGGVFAANFSMTGSMDDPNVTVNPLSALTPGILRGIFGVLGQREVADDKGENTPRRSAAPGQ